MPNFNLVDAVRSRLAPSEPQRKQRSTRPVARNPLGQRPDQRPAAGNRGHEAPQLSQFRDNAVVFHNEQMHRVVSQDVTGGVEIVPLKMAPKVEGGGRIVGRTVTARTLRAEGNFPAPANRFVNTRTIQNLYDVLDTGGIQGRTRAEPYTPQELKQQAYEVAMAPTLADKIDLLGKMTSIEGFRVQVARLVGVSMEALRASR